MSQPSRKQLYTGALLAIVATIIWAGNFIVARGVVNQIPPVSLAFYRWATASVIIVPFAFKNIIADRKAIPGHFGFLFWVALTGIALFNTFIYIAGQSTSAINMALIGTTSSPVFVIIIAALFLHEKINGTRLAGLLFCIAGIIVLLSRGSVHTLLSFRFGKGDVWVLLAALSFAVYNLLVKRKPAAISATSFLACSFVLGTILLLPFFLYEQSVTPAIIWNQQLITIILYLGLGTSVISFLVWNKAIAMIGAVRTSLFGNLIPIFATIEAILFLNEELLFTHVISGVLVIVGLAMANSKTANASLKPHVAS